MARNTTMLDLVNEVNGQTRNDGETIAAVVHLVNSGAVELCGTFKGMRFDTRSFEDLRAAA
jgi:hypothetical protein